MAFPYLTDVLNALFGTHWTLPIPTFGLCVAAAIMLATFVAQREVARRETLGDLPAGTHTVVQGLALVCAIAGIVGARVFYIADHASQFLADPAPMILSRSGFSIFGGLFFGVCAGMVYLRRCSVPLAPMLDATGPSLMLGYAVGRIGCQLAGDGDWGVAANLASKPSFVPDWLWAQTYDGNILGIPIPEPGVYPTPIYESVAAFALFSVLWGLGRGVHRRGFLFCVYLLLAGFERLLIEKIRINVEHEVLGIAMTQAEAISLLVIAGGLVGLLVTLRERRFWMKALISAGVLAALSACGPL
jgi:phosphatidylglycerol:prolipoprotein diacylglycerol transferase